MSRYEWDIYPAYSHFNNPDFLTRYLPKENVTKFMFCLNRSQPNGDNPGDC